jgi:uncharacterized protein (DUF2384 family)
MPVAEILEQKGILKSNSEFLSWIETPISELSNQKPSDLVRRGKLSEVLNYVNGLK